MTDQFLQAIIKELGPTGLLILGLYWIIGKNLEKMSNYIETINHNSTEIKDLLKELIQKEYRK